MSLVHIGTLAVVGVVCIASSVVLRRTAPPRSYDVLDGVYT